MKPKTYGLMAEFEKPEDLLLAARRAHGEGYRKMDAYTPFPIEHLSQAIGGEDHKLPWIVFTGGIIGALSGYFMQYYAHVIDYPVMVGGKPHHAWPSFIPVTFEMTILFAALSAVLGMLALNGLPLPYHPVFNVERFELASRSHFFLCVEARDPRFNGNKTREFLEGLKPVGVYEVSE